MASAVCVFAGSRNGRNGLYRHLANDLGALIAGAQRSLIYGAGPDGLMQAVCRGCLDAGGKVQGVVTEALAAVEEDVDPRVDLVVLGSLGARKDFMLQRAETFVALPGGLGTLDECLEVITWNQLNIRKSRMYIIDPLEYYQPLRRMLADAVSAQFASPEDLDCVRFIDSPRNEEFLNELQREDLSCVRSR